uniref:Uncharacterized protein n=1 Tax=Tanacetum cinerariifolium TaxID=118510 RepID=A0A699GS00_TANCI|nr:hypothetical protein [Tanacetum cinerariifolium]
MQHQNKTNELRAERLAHNANPLALVAQQQQIYHPQSHPTHYTYNFSTRPQQAATRNRGKAIVKSPPPTYDQEPTMVAEDNEMTVNVIGAKENVEVTPDVADNSGPIFDAEPLQKVQNDNDNYNVFANDRDHPEQSESINDTYPDEQGDTNITTVSLDMRTNEGEDEHDDDDLAREYLKKFQTELDRYHDVNYASKVEIDCAKAKGELISYKISFEKSFNEYTRKINDLNQTISDMKKELIAHQESIFIMSQEKEAQNKFYKTREDKENKKVIALENKVKVLDDIVYKTSQSVKTMNMLNRNCKTIFVKPEFLKKAQRANAHLYDIDCYNDNLALMLAPEYDETICLTQESRSN